MRPLRGFRVPPESYHRDLVRQPQPADSSHGLSLPSAHQGSEVYLTRARPPATFRPQGLVTLSTVCSLRAPAGFVSHRRRSWDSPFGAFSSRKVPAAFPRWMNPHTVFPVGIPARRSGWAGPTSRGFRAFTLPGVPGSPAGVNSPTAGCSLGLCPSRVLRRPAWPGPSPVLLPRASAITSLATSNRRRLGVSIGTPPGPAHTVRQAGQNGQDNPHRVLAPARSRPFERAWVRAIFFASCRAARCRRQADTLKTQRPSLY
jgi:hypothetical protein